ncbi:osmotically inducible protein C [Alkalihalophilus pseudofirmus]|uniref:OsmC family protein n=1 Tax=Alkalihalobacterium alkalinitrilicum TaxID=427920 RepID=UPI00094CE3BA|nr:OsmC family protein [Alkalihalobacterium alkalinitrilicum]OLO25166.1 osmotically inducible protein C [Alkalihalophilus pseudofirmus]
MEFTMKENGFKADFEYGTLHVSGNEEFGFRPYQLLVSSVAVCSGGVLRKVLAKKRLEYKDIKVSAEVTRNPEGAQEIQKIHMHFTIIGSNLSEEKIEKSLVVTKKNCSMVQSVKDSIEITESFEIVEG